jgi:hypothetical protein
MFVRPMEMNDGDSKWCGNCASVVAVGSDRKPTNDAQILGRLRQAYHL